MKLRAVLFLLVVISLGSCTKIQTTEIGSGLIPTVDSVATKDLILNVTTINAGAIDTLRMAVNEQHIVGNVNDPLFGKTSAKIDLQLQPSSYPYSFPVSSDSITLDSVVMLLPYSGAWGDTSVAGLPSLRVYEIAHDKPFSYDTISLIPPYPISPLYQVTENFNTLGELTNGPLQVNLNSVHAPAHPFSEDSVDVLRIPLSTSFGNKLLKQFSTATEYKNDTTFRTAFNGFQIVPQGGNSLLKLAVTNAQLALYFNYKTREAGNKMDTVARYFSVTTRSGHLNEIDRDRSTGEVANWLNKDPNRVNDSLIYLQTTPGTYSYVKIPGLDTLSKYVIHRAELLIDQLPGEGDNFFTPPNLFLGAYSEDSSRIFSVYPDVQFSAGGISNLISFGVLPFKQADNGLTYYRYSFNLSRFVQEIISKKRGNPKFVLYAPYTEKIYATEEASSPTYISTSPLNPVAIGRVRVNGGGVSNPHRMRLHIVYSLL